MDQQGQGQSQDSIDQLSHAKNTNHEVEQIMGNPSQGGFPPAHLPTMVQPSGGSQFALVNSSNYQQFHQNREIEARQRLRTFWDNQIQDIKKMTEFKNHSLPLARIKKIMKADEDVKMISSEAPMVFAKACEMFILELTLRSWCNTEENKRRTLLRNDVTLAIARTDIFDFLVDIIPREEVKEEPLFSMPRNIAMPVEAVNPADHAQTYYHPNLFRQHIPNYVPPVYWLPPPEQEDQQQQPPQSASDS